MLRDSVIKILKIFSFLPLIVHKICKEKAFLYLDTGQAFFRTVSKK